MKIVKAVSLLSLFAGSSSLVHARINEDQHGPTSGERHTAGYYMASIQTACRLLKVVKKHTSGVTEEHVECEMLGADLHGEAFRMLQVKGLDQSVIEEAESGEAMLFATGAIIDGTSNELLIPTGAKVELNQISRARENSANQGRRLTQIGNKEVLVLRERRSTYSAAHLSSEIFGTNGDALNLASQYAACSYGQLTFSKWTGNNSVLDGVLTVSIGDAIQGSGDSMIRDSMVNQAVKDLGGISLNQHVDHVMVCIPKGTDGGWIAYAFINHWLSVYNDNWCNFPSSQLHELGHNFNMAHSGDGRPGDTDGEYGDQSGMMGFSYGQDETPRMCFNAPKTYQFGWFSDYHVDLPFAGTNYWTGDLIGFAEKDVTGVTADDRMIIRIRADQSCDISARYCSREDYYVHFNRQIGFNEGTREGANQILVSKRASGSNTYNVSWLMANLVGSQSFTVPSFQLGTDNDLTITVDAIEPGIPRRASVSIQIGDIQPKDWQLCNNKLGLFDFGNGPRSCDWLRFREQAQITSLCRKYVAVSSLCTETCGLCSDKCEDDKDAFFEIDNRIGDQNCRWIAAQETRKDKYCHSGHHTFFICRETCKSCDEMYDAAPTFAPSMAFPDPLDDGECKDNDFWPFTYGSNKRGCVWLRRQPASFQTDFCDPEQEGYWPCEATCGRCTRPLMPGSCNNNGICDVGENCESCEGDCRVRHHATQGFCCVGGECHRGCNAIVNGKLWEC